MGRERVLWGGAVVLAGCVCLAGASMPAFVMPSSRVPATPAMLSGRSAATEKFVHRAPALRAAQSQALPSDCGIDPATGEICAGDPSIVLHTNIKMGDKKAAVQILKSTFDFCKVKALIFENVWQFMSSLSKALASGEHFSKVLFSVTLHNITSTDS
jgi:hypothetical protein